MLLGGGGGGRACGVWVIISGRNTGDDMHAGAVCAQMCWNTLCHVLMHTHVMLRYCLYQVQYVQVCTLAVVLQ